MNNLELKKAAHDVAYAGIVPTVQTQPQVDEAAAAQAQALQLTEAQYRQFKQDVNTFRLIYGQGVQQDTQATAKAAARPEMVPPPKPTVQPPPGAAEQPAPQE